MATTLLILNTLAIIYLLFIKDKPSILTSLHEFGHHLYGASELTACSYSICMYIKVFPEIYEKMTWQNHLLILKN